MASFNNGNITATVTPPQGYTGNYEYELQELVSGVWVTVNGTDKGFTGTFINPVTTSDETYTFGNPGGFDENQEGSSSWVGLAPAQYKIVVTTSDGLSCEVEGTGTVNESDPNLPVFTCNDANFQVANGTTGDTVSATADLGILVSVSPANYLDGNNTYTATITIPAGYQNAGNQLTPQCIDTATGTTVDPCSSFAAGVTSTVTNETTQGANDGTMTVSVNAGTAPFDLNLDSGQATYQLTALGSYTFTGLAPGSHTVEITDDNSCTDTETKTVGSAGDLCVGFVEGTDAVDVFNIENASSQGATDGSITVIIGYVGASPYQLTLNPGSIVQNLSGAGTSQFTGLAAGNYTIDVVDDNSCTVNLTATVDDGPDPCAGFQGIAVTSFTNPTAGASNGSITVSVTGGSGSYTWTLDGNAATPTDNGNETFTFSGLLAAEGAGTQYSIVLIDASCGTDNTQQTLVDPGSGGGTTTNVYLLHGGNVPNTELPYVVDITTATTYYVNGAFDTDNSTNALTNAMTYIIDNQGTQYVPNLEPLNITAINQTQLPNGITFPATSAGGNSFYYFIVNRDVISLSLETALAFSDPANGIPVNWTSFKDFTYGGANWRIYKTEANTSSGEQAYNCEIS